jgi:arginine decarboxylase-like protein
MDKIIEDIKNILVELTDNNIDFYIRPSGGNITIDFQSSDTSSSSLFTVRDTIKEYIQEIFIMLDDYCKENDLDIKVIYNSKISGKEYMTLSIDELLDMSKKGFFWKKSLSLYLEIHRKNRIDNFSSFKTKNPSN